MTSIIISSLFVCFCLLLELLMADSSSGKTCGGSEADLANYLFQNYQPRNRPRLNPLEPVNVTMSFYISSIQNIDAVQSQISLAAYFYIDWRDDYLNWQGIDNFSCIDSLVLPAQSVWLPDLALMSASQKYTLFYSDSGEKIRVLRDGSIVFRPGGTITVSCDLDLSAFPYDEQICKVNFQSWLYSVQYLQIILDDPAVAKIHWVENDEWQLRNMTAEVRDVTYSDKGHTKFHGVFFGLHLLRKADYYTMNVIVPSLIISFVEMVTFMLPIEEVAKVEFSFTALLAYTVFQGMVVPTLPQTSDYTPLLSLYIFLQMGYIGFAMYGQGCIFLMLNQIHFKKPPPEVLLKVAIAFARVVRIDIPHNCVSRQDKNVVSVDAGEFDGVFPEKKTNIRRGSRTSRESSRDEASEALEETWEFIALVFERIIAFIYLCLISLTPIFLFIVKPTAKYGYVRIH